MKKLCCHLLLALILAGAAGAEQKEKISMDFVNVDIGVVIKYISELTGKNFIIDEKVSGKVTIISPKKVTINEAYMVFESILETYGYITVPAGKVIKIVPIAEGRQKPSEVKIGGKPSRELRDRLVTQLIPLRYIAAQNLVSILRPLIPTTSYVAAYAPTNTIILVDIDSNRGRILSIIKQLDRESIESTITVFHLKYASARDLAQKIDSILNPAKTGRRGAAKSGTRSNTIADERMNALIVVGNELYLNKVTSLVRQLDVEAPPGRQEINVVYLKHAEAEELAKVLNQLAAAVKQRTAAAKTGRGSASKEKIQVTADKATNSLLITASPEDFITMETVIAKLDIARRQVFVEALIFEIRMDKTSKFGVEFRTTSNFTKSGIRGIGGTNFGSINNTAANPFNTENGLVLGVVDGIINFGGKDFLNIGGLVQALETEQGVNILSTPNLLTTDNEEAEMFVGETVPFVTSSAQTTGATPITNIKREDVGITLKIKPQINANDFVRLKIYQEISSISQTQLEKASDIITFTRKAETTVTVKNNQNIIIGGLIKDDLQDSVSKVPLLGDIPVLGWLFKSRSKQKVKTNLLIFLTPHIIASPEDLDAITRSNQQKMEKLQRGTYGSHKGGQESRLRPAGTQASPIPIAVSSNEAGEFRSASIGEHPELKTGKTGAEITVFEAPSLVSLRENIEK